jgi:hypothetical protein
MAPVGGCSRGALVFPLSCPPLRDDRWEKFPVGAIVVYIVCVCGVDTDISCILGHSSRALCERRELLSKHGELRKGTGKTEARGKA